MVAKWPAVSLHSVQVLSAEWWLLADVGRAEGQYALPEGQGASSVSLLCNGSSNAAARWLVLIEL